MHIYGIWKNGIDEPICRAERGTDVENGPADITGEGGWDEWREHHWHIYHTMCEIAIGKLS